MDVYAHSLSANKPRNRPNNQPTKDNLSVSELEDSMDMADAYGSSADMDKPTVSGQHVSGSAGLLNGDGSGMPSIETLLLNIQGLIKVATDTARHRDTQVSQDRGQTPY